MRVAAVTISGTASVLSQWVAPKDGPRVALAPNCVGMAVALTRIILSLAFSLNHDLLGVAHLLHPPPPRGLRHYVGRAKEVVQGAVSDGARWLRDSLAANLWGADEQQPPALPLGAV